MLQWMGGSQRKVANSRRSIQKRQKQYFEQRKRQHQEHEAALSEDNVDGLETCEHQRGSRSLDILSFLNVSKATEESRPKYVNENMSTMSNKAIYARDSEVVGPNHQPLKNAPTLTHEATAKDNNEPAGTSTPSSHQVRTLSSESGWRNTSDVKNTESACLKSAASGKFSILDLIGDDGATGTPEQNPEHESHVAFSIEGLGDLGTRTPMQSPVRHGRRLSGDQSSFPKAFKKTRHIKSFSSMLEDFGTGMECLIKDSAQKPSHNNHLDPFLIEEDPPYPFSCADNEQPTLQDGKPLGRNRKRCQMGSIYDQESHYNIWNANSPFLDNDGGDEKYGLNWRNRNAAHNSYSWENDSPNLMFDDCNLPLRYQKEDADAFNVLDDGDCHFRSVDEPKFFSFMHKYSPQAGYISLQMPREDAKGAFRSLSEESCSSSAVKGQDIPDDPSGSHRRNNIKNMRSSFKSTAKEEYGEEIPNRVARSMRQGEEWNTPRKYTRSNLSHSKPAYVSSATFSENLVDEDPWLIEEGFCLSNIKSHPVSFIQSSEKNRYQESDLFNNNEADLLHSTKCSFGRFDEKDNRDEFSSENPAFCQPFRSRKSRNISCFPKAGCGESWIGVHHDFEIHVQSSNSLEDGLFGEIESAVPAPDLSAQGSFTEGGGDKPRSQTYHPENIVQISSVDENIASESRLAAESCLKNSVGSPGMSKKLIPQDTLEYSSDEDMKEISFVMNMPHETDGEVIAKELHEGVPPKHLKNLKGARKERREGFDPRTVSIEPSCQVMMVERYVLQLLCLAKGKTVIQDATKKLL